jgi:methylated-DNA-[protein]-cysteine S-methyltransferase
MSIEFQINETVLGPIRLVAKQSLGQYALCRLEFLGQRHEAGQDAGWVAAERASGLFEATLNQLAAYANNRLKEFDLPLAPEGSPFQQAVWMQIRGIRYGATRSYGDIAKSLDKPSASRAVGAATGRNPIGIIVPCHRVLGANRSMTGYAGGLGRKHALLELEQGRSKQLRAHDNLGPEAAQWKF